ncbi:MAG TPA: hypothetical protein VGI86_14135 [Acidimicrobiia bacterium]
MGSLLVVTGPPGSGKSTIAPAVADQREPSELVTGDVFFGFVRRGAITPWLPEAFAHSSIASRHLVPDVSGASSDVAADIVARFDDDSLAYS